MLINAGLFNYIFVKAGPHGTARNKLFIIRTRIGEVQWGRKVNF
jgi:hypothetical protein